MRPSLLNPVFSPISTLPGVGPKMAVLFDRLLAGQRAQARVLDLLFHLPVGVIDRRLKSKIGETIPGEATNLEVRVVSHRPNPPGRAKGAYRVLVEDETGDVTLTFFNTGRARMESLLPIGDIRYISGTIELWDGQRQMVHPDRVLDAENFSRQPLFEPIYGLTAGLFPRSIIRAAEAALARLPVFDEWQNPSYAAKQAWPNFNDALNRLHRPNEIADLAPLAPARLRLAYDELLAGQLALLLMRDRMKRQRGAARCGNGSLGDKIRSELPFQLTSAQEAALSEIRRDLATNERMLRLLQGDVGSGKTIVALLAMADAVEAGWQAALMAPTEILARQHFARISPLCEKVGIRIGLLTGRDKGVSRAETLKGFADGSINIGIGTHALFQEAVEFKRLGLAVVDEQHRFGVHQRLALSRKGDAVDVLVMTATPIPRTLVLTFFGDMDVSTIREKPAGRQPIDTRVISIDRIDEVASGLGRAIANGQQIYWVCPLVAESEDSDLAAAEQRFEALKQQYGDSVGLVHGQMKGPEKDAAMAAFSAGETKILVATTVIEVGVDVPEASIMVIEHAERFGLAQLHQLRGRVGRGAAKSSCILLYGALGEVGKSRLETMRRTEDGFEIAEQDLKLRGEGDILGTRQSGIPGFRLTVPEMHAELLGAARDDAKLMLANDPLLATPRGEAVRNLLYLFEKDEAIRLIQAG